MQETWVQSLSREDPLDKEMATHSIVCIFKVVDKGLYPFSV